MAEIKEIPALVTIKNCVMSAMNALEIYHMSHYSRFVEFAKLGFFDLQLYAMDRVKTAYLTPNSVGIVNLPSDYVDYVSIGINVQGEMWTLGLNQNLIGEGDPDINCGALVKETGQNCYVAPGLQYNFSDHFRGAQYIGGVYGLGGGLNGDYYKVDKRNRRIILRNNNLGNNKLVVEYISTGVEFCGDTLIPRESLLAIRAFILWQNISAKPKVPKNEKLYQERLYLREAEKVNELSTLFTKDEYLDTIYKRTFQGVKR